MSSFQKAEKKQSKLRLVFMGPSGSGKTYSALLVATGIGKKIAVIDTENDSASLYSDEFSFDALKIEPPYTIDKYMDAIDTAVLAGYDVLIVDSITHAWAGEGGLLDKKGAIDIRGGNSYTNWAGPTKEHEKFKAKLLNCNIHLIATMRSKQDYVVELNDKGKSAPRKVGLAPIQREGMEYEFTMALDLGMDHSAQVSKTRIRSFDGKIFTPSKKTGEELLAWLNLGVAVAAPTTQDRLEKAKQAFIEKGMPQPVVESYFLGLRISFPTDEDLLNHLTMTWKMVSEGKVTLAQLFGHVNGIRGNHAINQ